ncbi:MAG TPA: GNAT family N-acetyltransferase [Caulobacteraceae bacterium]|jgi:GNAT superfamily N-acetyltransferase
MIDGLTLRRASTAEQRDLEALQRRASLMWEEDRPHLLANPGLIELPLEQIEGGRVFVADRRGVSVGFGVVLLRDDGEAELDGLFVEPDCWRQGIGSRLMQEAERLAHADGATWLFVVANPRAVGFYSACGFAPLGEVKTLFGVGLAMRKAIEAPVA